MILKTIIFLITLGYLAEGRKQKIGVNIGISLTVTIVLDFLLRYIWSHLFITVIIIAGVFGLYECYKHIILVDNNKKALDEWLARDYPKLSPFEFKDQLLEECDKDTIRYTENIPLNRTRYFSSGSEHDRGASDVFPIFYNARADREEAIFKEYGYLVTTVEVVVCKRKETEDETSDNETVYLPFQDVYTVKVRLNEEENNGWLYVYYADGNSIKVRLTKVELLIIESVFNVAIRTGWSKHVSAVINKELEDSIDDSEIVSVVQKFEAEMDSKNPIDIEKYAYYDHERLSKLAYSESEAKKKITKNQQNNNMMNTTILTNRKTLINEFSANQITDRFGGGQGHGHVGEQFGHVKDSLTGKVGERLGGTHEKYGADRIVNGVNIQTKYCATAQKSIASCFDSSGAKYINPDKTMMTIEVPSDQYSASVKHMENKIREGLVPNEADPQNASNYVKKGAVTYEHAQIATKSILDNNSQITYRDSNNQLVTRDVSFGEKLIYSAGGDFLTGVTAAIPTSTVIAVWVYCNNRWQGRGRSEALKNSLYVGIKPCLISGTIYMISAQFAGSTIGKNIGAAVLKSAGKSATTKEVASLVTKGTMGALMVAITVGPDLTDCLRGRISFGQLVKNSVAVGAGMAGMAVGATVGSIVPGFGTAVGGVIGGIVGSMGGKKLMDNFIEDDAKKMLQIAREEFIETIMLSGLAKEEFEDILKSTFLHKGFAKKLKEMHASYDSREYIHDFYVELLIEQFQNRERIPDEEIITAIRVQDGSFSMQS